MNSRSRELLHPNIVSFAISLIVAILLWANELFLPQSKHTNELFFNIFYFSEHTAWLSFLLTLGIAYLLFRSLDTFTFIQQRTILPFLIFILFVGTNYSLHQLTNGLIGSLFLLLSIWQIFSTFHKNEPVEAAFNAGLFLSIGYFFVFEFLFLIPLIIISLHIINNLSLRIVISALLGLLTPAIFVFGFCFWAGHLDAQLNYFINGIHFNFDFTVANHLSLIFSGISTIISLIAVFGCFQNRFSSSISERKNLQVLVWFFTAILIILGLRITQNNELLPSFLVICTFLFSIFFSTRFSKKNTIIFIVWIIFQLINLILGYNGQFS